jgi:hypothetical protein
MLVHGAVLRMVACSCSRGDQYMQVAPAFMVTMLLPCIACYRPTVPLPAGLRLIVTRATSQTCLSCMRCHLGSRQPAQPSLQVCC